MSCCTSLTPDALPERDASQVGRRAALRGLAGSVAIPGTLGVARGESALSRVRLAFCGQLLCVVPYEVAKAHGHFRDRGLEVELVYTRGGNQAMQALVGGAVDYAGTHSMLRFRRLRTGRRF